MNEPTPKTAAERQNDGNSADGPASQVDQKHPHSSAGDAADVPPGNFYRGYASLKEMKDAERRERRNEEEQRRRRMRRR